MNRRSASRLLTALVAVALVALAIVWWKTRDQPIQTSVTRAAANAATASGPDAALYFPATSGLLELEVRSTPIDLDTTERKLWLAEQLLAGPESDGLRRALPAEAQVASVFSAPDGTVYVDLTLPESGQMGMGSTEELLAVYSLVNTLLIGDETAERAVLLINGRQRESLAGHLDTARPLEARPDLVRQPG